MGGGNFSPPLLYILLEPSMDVAEFYDWVRKTLNRGTTLDDVIPHYIRAAVKEIENKRNFSKLEYWAFITFTPATNPIIQLPDNIKRVRFLRYNIAEEGKRAKWKYMKQVFPEEAVSRISDFPEYYWMKGRDFIVMDAQLHSKNRTVEMAAYRYSHWPDEVDGEGVSHWLLEAIPNGLHAKVMTAMAGFIREEDPNMIQTWNAMAQEAIKDLIDEDARTMEQYGPGEMLYWPDHIPYDRAFEDSED